MIQFLSYLLLTSSALCFPADILNRGSVAPEYLDRLLEEGKYEEFSKLIGVENVDLVKPSKEAKKNPMFDNGLEYGDMMPLYVEQEERQVINFEKYPQVKWTTQYIPYVISGGKNFTDEEEEAIKTGIAKWNSEMPCFPLQERKDEDNYVYILRGTGCWSHIGMITGPQALSLGKGCFLVNTVMHEMMHALGFAHEHMRFDRDKFVQVLWNNIPKGWWSQYQKMKPVFLNINKYDYSSLMHYPLKAPITNLPAFKILRKMDITTAEMGWIPNFSRIDKERIQETYC